MPLTNGARYLRRELLTADKADHLRDHQMEASGSRSSNLKARRIKRSVSSVGASRVSGDVLAGAPGKPRSSLLAEAEAAETLAEACDLSAFLDLARTANPRRMHLRIDLQVQGVAFLAPGRTRWIRGGAQSGL